MTPMLVDSHCHLDFPELQADLPGVLSRMRDNGVTHALTISTTLETFPAVRAVAQCSRMNRLMNSPQYFVLAISR